MESITLETINNSIGQVHHRIDDINNRINETNGNIRLLIDGNNSAHRDIRRQLETAQRSIANCEKKSSVSQQQIIDHLNTHKKDDERANINGIKLTSLFGNFGSAAIGAITVLLATGII